MKKNGKKKKSSTGNRKPTNLRETSPDPHGDTLPDPNRHENNPWPYGEPQHNVENEMNPHVTRIEPLVRQLSRIGFTVTRHNQSQFTATKNDATIAYNSSIDPNHITFVSKARGTRLLPLGHAIDKVSQWV